MNDQAKPKMVFAIEHLDASVTHLDQTMQVLSSIIMDLQKGRDFISRYRDSLIKTVEDTGGDVKQAVESQIRSFIPNREALDGKNQESQSGQGYQIPEHPQR